jgi:hypothetical protein
VDPAPQSAFGMVVARQPHGNTRATAAAVVQLLSRQPRGEVRQEYNIIQYIRIKYVLGRELSEAATDRPPPRGAASRVVRLRFRL